jgi:hypothetical protein
VLLFLVVSVAAVAAAILTTPVGQGWYDHIQHWSIAAYDWVRSRA